MGAQMQNELARVRVDTLNVTANNTQLEVQVKQVNEEIKEQDALVAKYEAESRRRHTEIEKKQHEIDLLNKKFEQMMAKRAGVEVRARPSLPPSNRSAPASTLISSMAPLLPPLSLTQLTQLTPPHSSLRTSTRTRGRSRRRSCT